MAIVLFKHNQETYQNMKKMFETKNRVGVVQPTGTGKSFLFLKWIEEYPEDKFIVLAPSTEIFVQLKKYAFESGSNALLNNVKMISYQALILMEKREIDMLHADKIVIDEYHRAGAEQWGIYLQWLLNANPNAKVLGTTATPVRYLDNVRNMTDELFDQNLAREMTLGEAVRQGILPTPKYIPVWYDVDGRMEQYQKEIDSIDNEEKKKALQKQLDYLKDQLENSYGTTTVFREQMPHNHGKYIVFCKNVDHLYFMQLVVRSWLYKFNPNIHMYVSVSENSDKKHQVQKFRDDEDVNAIKLLFTVDRLNEGVHIKGLDGVIMLRPTTSPIIYLQQMGRALASGNKEPLIFDLVNNYDSVTIMLESGKIQNVFEKEFEDAAKKIKEVVNFKIFERMVTFNQLFEQLEDVLYFDNEDVWLKTYETYKDFKRDFKREPKSQEKYNDKNIGAWCSRQRELYFKNLLLPNRIALLHNAGFDFESKKEKDEKIWNSHFELLKEFIETHGREPSKTEVLKNFNIGLWWRTQRQTYRAGKLSPEREEKIRSLDLDFKNRIEKTWRNNFELLKEYIEIFQKMPAYKEMYKGKHIGEWCSDIKKQYNKGVFPSDKEKSLREIGFDFEPLEKKIQKAWDDNFSVLKEFVDVYRRCPVKNEVYKNKKIGSWCSDQKKKFNKGLLSKEREEKLRSVGFSLDNLLEVRFTKMANLLKEFTEINGREPTCQEVYKDVNLGVWCLNKRREFKKGTLSKERQKILVSVGFSLKK